MAFFGLYVWHSLLIYVLVRQLSGFRWSASNIRLGLFFLPATGLVFGGFMILPVWSATAIGLAVTLLCGVYSLRVLAQLLPMDWVPSSIKPWLPKPA